MENKKLIERFEAELAKVDRPGEINFWPISERATFIPPRRLRASTSPAPVGSCSTV